ncbi:hypothetical protein DVH24_014545 [Malus domestica]|uniref:Ubiquitin-like protease family profile domain-containing protein n=1 Tax=Malus domestica TaxID=3750 RepID=A0A498KIH5_MALDO|nr:hypothetical protein DVH24_014545 [Malus domestica]
MNIGIELNEEYLDEMTDSEEDEQDFVTKKPRGATQLQELVRGRSDGDQLEVGYNSKGQPCGLAGAKLASFIGVMARNTVPITIPTWKEVESSYKKKIWDMVQKIHEEQSRRQAKHKYPHRLSRKGYARLEEQIKSAYGITADINRSVLWKLGRVDKKGNYTNEMVKVRADTIDEVTKAIEDGTLRTSGSNDILTIALETPEYSGRVRGVGTGISHKLYFKTPKCKTQSSQQQMMQTHLEQQSLYIEELNKKFNLIASLLTPDQLSKMQKLAQSNVVQSNHISEKASCTAKKEKNETSTEKVKQGDLVEIMSKKRAKHDDVPEIMSKKRVKQKVSKNTKTMDKIEAMKVKQKDMQEISDLNIMEKTNKIANSNEKESDIKKHFKCKLAIDTASNIVAYGSVIPLDRPIHGVPLGPMNLHVSIDVAIKEDVLLPIPSCEAVNIKQAIGSHVAWPRHLVVTNDESRTNPHLRQRFQKQPLALRSLMLIAQNMHKDVTVPIIMESDLFGNEHTTFIGGDDIIQFCSMAKISTVCISIYIRQLWSTLKKNNLDGLFGFVDPGRISQKAGRKEQRSNALALRLQNCKKGQLIFAPYNKGFHWLLAIIDPYEELVYYMDSLNWIQIDPRMKDIVELALKMFKAQKGIKGRKNINWKVVKCPLQEGTVECGYYVMKYMKEIINDPNCSIITKFKEKATYTQHEIDALRIEWAEYVDDFIPIDETLD